MKITDLCKTEVDDWQKMEFEGQSSDQLNFFHALYGISFHASIRDDNTLHVSVGPIRNCRPDFTDEEHAFFILKKTPEILMLFCGERSFQHMPPHPAKPDVNHYFSKLRRL